MSGDPQYGPHSSGERSSVVMGPATVDRLIREAVATAAAEFTAREVQAHANWEARIAREVATERERCAKILSDYADARAYDPEEHDDLMEVVARIRSSE